MSCTDPEGERAPGACTPNQVEERDRARFDEVVRYDLTTAAARVELDLLATQIAAHFEIDAAVITLFLADAQLFAGQSGLGDWVRANGGLPFEWSLCAEVATFGRPHSTRDVRNFRGRENPLVAVEYIVSYAGAPLLSPSGLVLGTCAVLSREPRSFDIHDLMELEGLARLITVVLERYVRPHVVDRPNRPAAA